MKKTFTTVLLIFIIAFSTFAQDTIIVDKIVARVGDDIILQSDIEQQYVQMLAQRMITDKNSKCEILENLLFHKLLINQADIDSIYVENSEVEGEVSARVDMFLEQAGGISELEIYLGKSIFEIKEGLVDMMKEQLRAQKVQMSLSEGIKITPSEVTEFYNKLDKDSLPIVDEMIELQVITIKPKITKEQEQLTINKMNSWKKRIQDGEKHFESIALVYSDDNSSAGNGGQLPFMARGELVPEYSAAAFKLKKGELSEIVKTDFGFHLIRLDERKGERVKTSHILITPKTSSIAQKNANKKLDSIQKMIKIDSISFEKAALKYSDDKNTNKNGGIYFNPNTGSAKIAISALPKDLNTKTSVLEIGEISEVIETRDDLGNITYNIYKIKSRTGLHIASVNSDFELIHNMALEKKKAQAVEDWISEKLKTTYIHIDKKYNNCDFRTKGWLK